MSSDTSVHTLSRSSRLVTLAAWGLVALGLFLRLRQYLANRSLWLDEAMLALNIIQRDAWGLLGKLDYDQGAPVGFLLLEKLMVSLFGDGERALRLVPLLAGCASLVLFYLLVRRLLNSAGLLTALALFALSPSLVYYSSEVKQYATDVFVTLLLFYLFVEYLWWSQGGHERPAFIHPMFVVGGVLAPWFSHPAVFVLAALGLMLLWEQRSRPIPVLVMGVGWLLSIGVLYLVNLRGLAANDFLRAYWQEYFRQNPLVALQGLLANPAWLPVSPPLLHIAALGGVGFLLFQKKNLSQAAASSQMLACQPRQIVVVFLLVLFITYLASWLHLYPFGRRMILFLVPLVYIFIAAAVDWLWHFSWHHLVFSRFLAAFLLGFSIYQPLVGSVQDFFATSYSEHVRPAITYLNAHYRRGDVVYVYYWAVPAFRYYAAPTISYVVGNRPKDLRVLMKDLDALRGQKRVWLLFSHVLDLNDHDGLLSYLDEIGQRQQQLIDQNTNVYLYLYDLR